MFKKEIKIVKNAVDSIINESLENNLGKEFQDISTYQIKAGGKRLRPFILLSFYKSLGGENEDKALRLAAAIEIFHNYSLLIDDIIDRGEVRRGKETTWKKYGESTTMCISSFYFSTIVELLAGLNFEIAAAFSKETKRVMEGEIIDILQERGSGKIEPFIQEKKYTEVNLENYFEMAGKKTAALFEATAGLGAFLAGEEKEYLEAGKKFGEKFGLAYQIRDDILDIYGDEKKFGKEIGKDIKERKGGNIVLLLAQKENKELGKLLNKNKIKEKTVKKAMKIINKTDAKEKANNLCQDYTNEAMLKLDYFPKSKDVDNLRKLVEYIKQRKK